MKLVVTDTSVFIDLIDMGVLAPFFALGFEVHTTAFVVDELNAEQHVALLPFIGSRALVVDPFSGEKVTVVEAMETRARLSFTDRSVIHLALQLNATVLSGDGGIRKECKARQMQLHGSIWVVEQLWQVGLVAPVSAIANLEWLRTHNHRLPVVEIDALIDRIRKR